VKRLLDAVKGIDTTSLQHTVGYT